MEMIRPEYINLDLKAQDSRSAIAELAKMLFDSGAINSIDTFETDAFKREEALPTEMEWGVAMPHARSAAVISPCIVFAKSQDGFYWNPDSEEKTYMVFLFAVPDADSDSIHLNMISSVACALLEEEFRTACSSAKTKQEVSDILKQAVSSDTN
jgi:fructose-specific phosphotransferase system IIA component